jgi:hypothetical protein
MGLRSASGLLEELEVEGEVQQISTITAMLPSLSSISACLLPSYGIEVAIYPGNVYLLFLHLPQIAYLDYIAQT